ncbi:unnamed protein product [Diabrotica balteata]|uniref:Myb-like domain-containing protein n=1 Tax=Diabrotica balteata TaxID=107213 RepID=A0A9N9T3G9_DIABA|nr:unnamed protein product [Diabrotica balteata]
MGANSSKKLAAKCPFLSKDEQLIVSNSFKLASKNSEKIKEEELTKIWGSQVDPRLLQYLNNYLFGLGDLRQTTVELEKFAELFVFCTRGTVDEKVKVLLTSLGNNDSESSDIPYMLVKEYVESIVASYMKIQKLSNNKQYKTWFSKGCFTLPQNIQRLAESLTHELATGEIITRRTLETWLQGATLLGQLLLYVSMYLFSITHKEKGGVATEKTEMSEVAVGSILYICNMCDHNCGDPQLMIHHMNLNHSFSNESDALKAVTAYTVKEVSEANTAPSSSASATQLDNIDKKVWTREATLIFIQLVEENDENFQKSIKKHIWAKIASSLNKQMNVGVTWQQCDTKWKSLKKTYKDIKDYNATSGKNRRKWEFYNEMNNILFNKPEICAPATCSSNAGLVINEDKENQKSPPSSKEKRESTPSTSGSETFESSFSKKRKLADNAVERRHKEKIQRQDRFLNCFEDFAMGGQHGYWGLWIDSEYGSGQSSPTCTTYRSYNQLSHAKEFTFRHMEVWGIGQPPPTPQEKGERITGAGMSVLDGNLESKAMLKMAGKTLHSEGIVEPQPE